VRRSGRTPIRISSKWTRAWWMRFTWRSKTWTGLSTTKRCGPATISVRPTEKPGDCRVERQDRLRQGIADFDKEKTQGVEEPENFGFHYPERVVDQACKLLVVTDYHLWGAVDQRVLDDPQWWADVYLCSGCGPASSSRPYRSGRKTPMPVIQEWD